MKTCYVFQSDPNPNLLAFTDGATGEKLPSESGPWTFVKEVGPAERWTFGVGRAFVAAGILENGFLVWEASDNTPTFHPVIESDRVEGTAVFNQQGRRIGTIKRLLIEKVSGKVLYVDVTFGGFLGIGVHHRTLPWDKLSYDKALEGYRTEITEEQVRDAPSVYGYDGDDLVWPDRKREKELRDYWHDDPRGPF
jgi:PRC-barrel domain